MTDDDEKRFEDHRDQFEWRRKLPSYIAWKVKNHYGMKARDEELRAERKARRAQADRARRQRAKLPSQE